jgi:hypothetical protein
LHRRAVRVVDGDRAPKLATDPRQLRPRRLQCDVEPDRLILAAGNKGDRAHLVEGEASLRERGVDAGQNAQRMTDAEHLPRGTQIDPGGDRQPVCTAPHADARPLIGVIEGDGIVDEPRG